MDPLELVRYAESECQALFNANEMVPHIPQEHSMEEPQVLSMDNICMIYGSWTSISQFSGSGWVWMDSLGKVELIGTDNYLRRESALHSEAEALWWAMESMSCIQKQKHYDGWWRVCFSSRHVRPLGWITRIWSPWLRSLMLGQAS